MIDQHVTNLQQYFDGDGFDRWVAIYQGHDDLSYIRRTVHEGHERMLKYARDWLLEDCPPGTLLDAGCGTGVFSIAMAQQGYDVTGVDVSPRMAAQAAQDAADDGVSAQFQVGDIQAIDGTYDAVACFDVLVHYPEALFVEMCHQLCQRSSKTLLLTYAPHSNLLAFMHWIGGHFPQGNRRTEIQMIKAEVVERALADAGMRVKRTVDINQGFYHVKLLQAIF